MAKGEKENNLQYADRFPGARPLHGGSDMYQWAKVGQELVGEFMSIKPYNNGHIANILTKDGVISFSAPTILAGVLEGVKRGTRIAIVFSGEKQNEGRGRDGEPLNPTKLFEVYEAPNRR